MSSKSAPKYWRSIEQLENSPEFLEFMHREFPVAASEYPQGVSRRRWMQLMGASFALASVAGCRWETERIAPLVHRPEGYIPGKPLHYATSFDWAGAPRHLLVTNYDGRPIKIEGNPEHPGSLGATDGLTQAATLTLYDPDRSHHVVRLNPAAGGENSGATPSRWGAFEEYAKQLVTRLKQGGGGLAVLMEPSSSLSREAMLGRLAETLPGTQFFEYTPFDDQAALAGAEQAFGQPLRVHYHLAKAKVIATFDADLLCHHPNATRYARDWAATREISGQEAATAEMSRMYALESQFSITGAAADHRVPVRSSDIGLALSKLRDQVEARLAGNVPAEPEGLTAWQTIKAANDRKIAEGRVEEQEKLPPLTSDMLLWCLAEDLVNNPGAGVVAVGARQTPELHAMAHELNSLLGNFGSTVTFTELPQQQVERGTIVDLAEAIRGGSVKSLLVLEGNPAYDAPADLEFGELLKSLPDTIRAGYYLDETSLACQWHLPLCHPLEAWGDATSYEGIVSVAQPMVAPLVDARSPMEILGLLAEESREPQQIVRDVIGEALGGPIENDAWEVLLHDGFAEGSIAVAASPTLVEDFDVTASVGKPGIEIVFTPSSSTYDGRLANNGWLQETPDFMTKVVWDNVAVVSPYTAREVLKVKQNDIISIKIGEKSISLPVYELPGQANGSIGVALGYGRTAAGRVGGSTRQHTVAVGRKPEEMADHVGVNSYLLRTTGTMLVAPEAEVKATGRRYNLATTQDHFAIDEVGLNITEKRVGMLVREGTLEEYHENPEFAADRIHQMEAPSLWDAPTFRDRPNAWGMAVDLNKCIGCNACVVACQAENNVPIVGPEQVRVGRQMHWIRIDRYFAGDISNWYPDSGDNDQPDLSGEAQSPQVANQMLTCQQCERAPCEEVCPVAATTHSEEGLNDMTYNRCVGTRYCANNCPYKVRRFNYFHNTGYMEKQENQLLQLVLNPEVTVRTRGVMEKCTFCVQRIAAARQQVRITGEPIVDGTITPACAQACATQAILFGDLNDSESRVSKAHADPRAYELLTELKTKPRNQYLARVRNPHPRLSPSIQRNYGHGHGHGDGDHPDDTHSRGPEGHARQMPARPGMLLDIDTSLI